MNIDQEISHRLYDLFLIFLDGNKEEFIMATVHYLIIDEVMVICTKNTYTYKTLHNVQHLEDVWKQEVKIVDPYGCHELSGIYPEKWDITEKDGLAVAEGYRYPKYKGYSKWDDALERIISYDEYPKEVRIFRTVYELEGGELPVIDHTVRDRSIW